MEFVLCHTDIHGGNILISDNGELYIVDWDAPILAPKERDLMFIGGGVDWIWKSEREENKFYEGYGKPGINLSALAYYRYERIIQDLAAICEQLLLTDEGGADRQPGFEGIASNFESGHTIDIADKTYRLLSKPRKFPRHLNWVFTPPNRLHTRRADNDSTCGNATADFYKRAFGSRCNMSSENTFMASCQSGIFVL